MAHDIYLSAPEIVCAVGHSAAEACAAMRAGLAGFEELPYLDNEGQPIMGARVADMPPGAVLGERLAELGTRAVRTWAENNPARASARTVLLLGVDEPNPAYDPGHAAARLLAEIQARAGVSFHPTLSRTIAAGHTAAFRALEAARQILSAGEASACLVCAVDSLVLAPRLAWLDAAGRLKTMESSDGLIPGEAAACLLVEGHRPRHGVPALRVRGLGFGRETAHVLSDAPLLGLGLASAVRAATGESGWGLHEIDFRISDVTGEHYGFKEQALMMSRVMRDRREAFPLWHPADSVGDTGAAAGAVMLASACHAFWKKYSPGARALATASAASGDRAAAVLESAS